MRGSAQRIVESGELQNIALRDGRAQQHRDNVHHGQRDPSQDDAVHEKAQVNGFESAQERGG